MNQKEIKNYLNILIDKYENILKYEHDNNKRSKYKKELQKYRLINNSNDIQNKLNKIITIVKEQYPLINNEEIFLFSCRLAIKRSKEEIHNSIIHENIKSLLKNIRIKRNK